MSKYHKFLSAVVACSLITLTVNFGITPAHAQIDVSNLQACLKEEGSSLDVLVLMDSSRSLRDGKPGERREVNKGSDSEGIRGKVLTSSLKILRALAEESDRKFNISLRNFGNNSDPKGLSELKENWVDWTGNTSDPELAKFVEKALYNDSPGTQWANGLISAKDQFKKRIGETKLAGNRTCSIMFWITDGAPTDSTDPICSSTSEASINWFRENNILILGGLLKPLDPSEAAIASQFGPLVRGETCGQNEDGWTRGEVIVAKDISDLAWEFVDLIAGIKNLINLNGNGSSFNVDPSTSHIEIYTRKASSNWEVKKPDGSVFCSASNPGMNCSIKNDSDVGIVTVTIFPDKPINAAGAWTISPGVNSDDFLVYGGLSTATEKSRKTKPNLLISQDSLEAEEGKNKTFLASLVNPDGSAFSLNGFKSVTICAKVESSQANSCESGKSSANLTVNPSTTDKSVSFEAVLVSEKDPSRQYRISATAKISVIPSGLFPSLACEKEPCVLSDLKNKNSKAISNLLVKAPSSGTQGGTVKLMGTTILSDRVEDRGDGHFKFVVEKENGEIVDLGDASQVFNPGDKLKLIVSTDLGGSSEIQGILKYKVSANGQDIVRQLDFRFNVGAAKNWPLLIGLMLIAYLLTVGLPYAFLLWSARRRAVLTVPDSELAYLEELIVITQSGKIISKSSKVENDLSASLEPSHKGLNLVEIPENSRSISIASAQIEVIPPKWNPFVEPTTIVTIPGNHVLSTYGGTEFLEERVFFSRSLVGEAIIYFASEEGLAPISQSEVQSFAPDSKSELFSVATVNVPEEELVKKSGDIHATALFIVPRYGNRRKTLAEANTKLKNATDGANLAEHISKLRQDALESKVKEIEDLKKVEFEKSGKKKPSKTPTLNNVESGSSAKTEEASNRFSIFEEQIKGDDVNFSGEENINPDSENGKKLWD
jgi:hypothetical protein